MFFGLGKAGFIVLPRFRLSDLLTWLFQLIPIHVSSGHLSRHSVDVGVENSDIMYSVGVIRTPFRILNFSPIAMFIMPINRELWKAAMLTPYVALHEINILDKF